MELADIFEDSEDLVDFQPGDLVFEEGSDGHQMWVVMSGEVRLSLRGETIGVEHRGGIIGEMALLNSSERSATGKATKPTVLAPIDEESFLLLIKHRPEFSLHVMNVLADRLRLANELLSA